MINLGPFFFFFKDDVNKIMIPLFLAADVCDTALISTLVSIAPMSVVYQMIARILSLLSTHLAVCLLEKSLQIDSQEDAIKHGNIVTFSSNLLHHVGC